MTARTLVDVLLERGEAGAEPAIWLDGEGEGGRQISCAELAADALAFASRLAGAGVGAGDKVVVVLPTGADFVRTFYGTLCAGAAAVPLYPPAGPQHIGSFVESLRRVVAVVRPAKLVTFEPLAGQLRGERGVGDAVDVAVPAEIDAWAGVAELPSPRPEDTALIQFSSGSTGDPRGVVLTHDNVVYNVRSFQRAIDIGPPDVVVSWLPMYHDMGLIGTLIGSLVTQIPLSLLSPLDFIRKPQLWLEALSRRRATIGVAPQFAYGLCLRKLTDEQIAELDLSSVRVLLNGAEPVDLETVRRFERRFAAAGLRPGVVTPCYGLAESALAVSFDRPGQDTPHRHLDRATGEVLRAPRLGGDARVTAVIPSTGRPVHGTEVAILSEDGDRLPDEAVGEIAIRSRSVCRGYQAADGVRPSTDEAGWLRTGDLGFLSDGELYVVGRVKDLVIVGGRNLHPHDVEGEAAAVPGIRPGRVIAFGTVDRRHGAEALVVVAETRKADEATYARQVAAVRRRVVEAFGVAPHDVVLLPQGSVPLTSSGKVRRHRMRMQYEQGAVEHALFALRREASHV